MLIEYRLIQCLAIGHIVLGLCFPFLGQLAYVNELLLAGMFPNQSLSHETAAQASFLITLFGPTVASWGILLLVLSNQYFSSPNKNLWRGMIIAVLVWYVGDTSYSGSHGASGAVLLNSIVAILFLIPLWRLRKLINCPYEQS